MIFGSFCNVIESFIQIKAYSNALEVVQFIENNTAQKNYLEKMHLLNIVKKRINDIKNNCGLQTNHLAKYKSENYEQNNNIEILNLN